MNRSSRSRSPYRDSEISARKGRSRNRASSPSSSSIFLEPFPRKSKVPSPSPIRRGRAKTREPSLSPSNQSFSRNRSSSSSSVVSNADELCNNDIFRMCSQISFRNPKWFQERNECIYNYLNHMIIKPKVESLDESTIERLVQKINEKMGEFGVQQSSYFRIDEPNIGIKVINALFPIFDVVMAFCILGSFQSDVDRGMIDVINNTYSSIKKMNFGGIMRNDGLNKRLSNITNELVKCNIRWNNSEENLPFLQEVSNNLNLKVLSANPDYINLKTEIQFLSEIMGVIDRPDYIISKSNVYLEFMDGYEVIRSINKANDALCKSRAIGSCDLDNLCHPRGQVCQNKDRYVNMNRKGYYILDNVYLPNYTLSKPKYNVYISLARSKIVSGNCGIFERKSVVDVISVNEKRTQSNNEFSIVFPPFDMTGKNAARILVEGSLAFYFKRGMKKIRFNLNGRQEEVGVSQGIYDNIESWYNSDFLPLLRKGIIMEDSTIFITGTSLGGALTNMCAFLLRIRHPNMKIHFYANGAPRVGNKQFKEFMERDELFESDSGNFVRYINIINNSGDFITEFDPLCKFPPSHTGRSLVSMATPSLMSSLPYLSSYTFEDPENLKFSDNPKLNVVESGYLFNPYVTGFGEQPDYEFVPFVERLRGDLGYVPETDMTHCSNHNVYIHSIQAYASSIFDGGLSEIGDIKYEWNFDSIRNLSIYPCSSEDVGESPFMNVVMGGRPATKRELSQRTKSLYPLTQRSSSLIPTSGYYGLEDLGKPSYKEENKASKPFLGSLGGYYGLEDLGKPSYKEENKASKPFLGSLGGYYGLEDF